jgi:hypothetical protein
VPPPAPQSGPPPSGPPQYAAPPFGTPQYAAPPFGTPQYAAPPYGAPPFGPPPYGPPPFGHPPTGRPGLPGWGIALIAGGSIVLILAVLSVIAIPVLLSQRSTPVTPEQLGGLGRSTDPQLTSAETDIHNDVVRLNPGVRTATAVYGTMTAGYVLLSLAAPLDTAQELHNLGGTSPPVNFGDVLCATNASTQTSACVRTSARGSVEVATFTSADLARLAVITREAWRAQPFGCTC